MGELVGVCGCICSDCSLYDTSCKGCYAIKGVACWLHEVGLDVCDFYACCKDKQLEHCGECKEIPCDRFWQNKNPKWTDEEHRQIVTSRVKLLKALHVRGVEG